MYLFFAQIRVKVSILQFYCKGVEAISNSRNIKKVGSKFEFLIMSTIFLILKEKSHFKLMDILEREIDKNEDEIISALESLIESKLIKPIK